MAPKNPILISSMGYRKAVVRHFVEQLRELEGRLEKASGPRWETQLHSCEDLAGVARLMLTLQRRIAPKGIDNTWLEELAQLSAADIDERAIELVCRRRRHRWPALPFRNYHQLSSCPAARLPALARVYSRA